MVLIIIGIVLTALGYGGAIANVGSAVRNPDRLLDEKGFGNVFGRQMLFGFIIVIGLALALIGLVLVLL